MMNLIYTIIAFFVLYFISSEDFRETLDFFLKALMFYLFSVVGYFWFMGTVLKITGIL